MHRSSVWLWAFFALTALTSSVVRASADAAIAKTTIPISPDFTNVKLLRVLDLRTNIVQEDLGVRAKNIQSYPVSEYIFMLPQEEEERAASVSAFLRQEPKTSLSITQVGFDSEKQVQLYKITFDEPVQPGQEIRFGVKIAYTHALEPLPARIPQVARQFVLYNGNVYSYSAYPSDEIKTTVQLPTKMIQSFTGGDFVQQSGNKIIYGPFENAGPELFAPLRLHYEYSKPLLTVTELRRDLQVSHWGNNLAVEEDYKLYHAGAQLEEEFSRITYQMTRMVHSQTNVLKDLTFRLPAGARDVYYRDEIGNVSTSHFRPDKDAAIFQFAPRYPLFGGWNYTWYHGYNVDLNKFVRYSKETGQYMLNVNFVDNVYDMAVDKLRLNIVLPEGATNVKVHAPFKLDREEHATHFTNFDSTGRYLLILEKHNVVKEHEQPIQITYEYPSYRLLQKPLVVSGCLFTLFMITTILSKISFTIGTPKKPALKKE